MAKVNYLFIGNPGTGKSTLINCLMKRPVCKSGLSWGQGLTFEFTPYNDGSDVYMDTPGLADVKIEKEAGENITKALQAGGNYKLFFMVRIYQGRVVHDDVATIHKVLESIHVDHEIPFSVLVNQILPEQYKMLMKRGRELELVVAGICSGNYKTKYIEFIPAIPQLSEQSNAVMELPPGLIQFIKGTGPNDAPIVNIAPEKVHAIDTDVAAFKEMVAVLREQIAQLTNSNAALEKKLRQLEEDSGFWTSVGQAVTGIAAFLGGALLLS